MGGRVTDQQVKRLWKEVKGGSGVSQASMRADMDRRTGRKYMMLGKLPSEVRGERTWRTRRDPFEDDWKEMEEKLALEPGLEAKTLFEELRERKPGKYEDGQLRTFRHPDPGDRI
jgi:hypothetical protein